MIDHGHLEDWSTVCLAKVHYQPPIPQYITTHTTGLGLAYLDKLCHHHHQTTTKLVKIINRLAAPPQDTVTVTVV